MQDRWSKCGLGPSPHHSYTASEHNLSLHVFMYLPVSTTRSPVVPLVKPAIIRTSPTGRACVNNIIYYTYINYNFIEAYLQNQIAHN